MPVLHRPALLALLAERGMTQEELATKSGVRKRTVSKAFGGKQSVSAMTHACLAEALGVQPDELLPPTTTRPKVRSIAGKWTGEGRDLPHPSGDPYAIPLVGYEFEMTVIQNQFEFTASGSILGQAGTPQKFSAKGSLKEGGNYLVFEWENTEDAVLDYGIAIMEYKAVPNRLVGLFLGRERNHGADIILGQISATKL